MRLLCSFLLVTRVYERVHSCTYVRQKQRACTANHTRACTALTHTHVNRHICVLVKAARPWYLKWSVATYYTHEYTYPHKSTHAPFTVVISMFFYVRGEKHAEYQHIAHRTTEKTHECFKSLCAHYWSCVKCVDTFAKVAVQKLCLFYLQLNSTKDACIASLIEQIKS